MTEGAARGNGLEQRGDDLEASGIAMDGCQAAVPGTPRRRRLVVAEPRRFRRRSYVPRAAKGSSGGPGRTACVARMACSHTDLPPRRRPTENPDDSTLDDVRYGFALSTGRIHELNDDRIEVVVMPRDALVPQKPARVSVLIDR